METSVAALHRWAGTWSGKLGDSSNLDAKELHDSWMTLRAPGIASCYVNVALLVWKKSVALVRLHRSPSSSRRPCRLAVSEDALKIHQMAFGCHCPSRKLHAGYEILGAEMTIMCVCVEDCTAPPLGLSNTGLFVQGD